MQQKILGVPSDYRQQAAGKQQRHREEVVVVVVVEEEEEEEDSTCCPAGWKKSLTFELVVRLVCYKRRLARVAEVVQPETRAGRSSVKF